MNEVLKQLISHIELPEDHLKDQDPEIRDIFIEEVEEILELQQRAIPHWLDNPADKDVLTEIRRSFHTLKGSGRMAGAVQSGELAWSIEEMLNRVMSGAVALNRDIQELVYSVSSLYPILVEDFKQLTPHQVELRTWIVTAQRLRDSQAVEPELRYTIDYYRDQTIPQDAIATADTSVEEAVVAPESVPAQASIAPTEEASNSQAINPVSTKAVSTEEVQPDGSFPRQAVELVAESDPSIDKSIEKQTLEIFIEESTEHLETISGFLHLEEEPSVDAFNQLIRAVHTIRGSSGMVGFDAIFTASSHVENVFKTIDPEQYPEHPAEEQLLSDYYEYVRAYVAALEKEKAQDFLTEISAQFDQIWQDYQFNNDREVGAIRSQGIVAQLLELDINDMLDAEFSFAEQARADNAESYFQLLAEQVTTLVSHCNVKQSDELCRIAAYLKRCYQALVAHPVAAQDQNLMEQIQGLHQYLIDAFDGMASGQNMALTNLIEEEFEQAIEDVNQVVATATPAQTSEQADLLETIAEADPAPVAVAQNATELDVESGAVNNQFDPEMLEIFLEESDELIAGMDQDFNTWEQQPENTQVLNNLFRYLHTLKGGANMIQATHMGDVAHELESIYQRIVSGQGSPDAHAMQRIRYAQDEIANRIQLLREQAVDRADPSLIADLQDILANHLHAVSAPEALQTETSHADSSEESSVQENAYEVVESFDDSSEFAFQVDPSLALDAENRDFDADLLDIFLEESDELVAGMDQDFAVWEKTPSNTTVLNNLFRYLHTLKGGANMVQATHLGDIAHELESIYEKVVKGQYQPNAQAMQMIRYAQDDIAMRLQKLRDQGVDEHNPSLIAALQAISTQRATAQSAPVKETSVETTAQATTAVEQDTDRVHAQLADQAEDTPVTVTAESSLADAGSVATPAILAEAQAGGDEQQIIIIETYLEEADEIFEQARHDLDLWKADRGNRSILLSLQRGYHTLKGNARILEQQLVGEIAYRLEVLFEQFAFHQFTSDRYDHLIAETQVWLHNAVYRSRFEGAESLNARLQNVVYDDSVVVGFDRRDSDIIDFKDYQEYQVVQGDGSTPPEMYSQNTVQQEQGVQEQIRVSADLVEKMIDLSGESAINRSRIELDLGQMNNTLSEMELAIQRLADQLRRMDGELETQILAKHEVEGQRYADFDPLEMDQYSSLNQLSKSLAESASDLIDFKITLADKIRDTESLLLQQSRLQNELQQSLMGTRLVPFSRLVPRLQRLVRQTSTQLNRPVEFNIENTEGELDRNILERLVSPLEHMLRNAIDHGIEDRAGRAKAKKQSAGKINLNIAREGNDILVIFSDDGRGIDVTAVKEKASKNGLITADMQVSDEDVMQYIFHPGLSTAQKVTQISGRGVGLDVVQNEIKSLGGHVSVKSTFGKGTEFTIRVPTTVSVSDALMVRVGDQQFALPLAQIERIVRVSPVALSEYYDSKQETFELDDQKLRLRYVGEFVTGQVKPIFNNMGSSVPVIIFNSAGRSVALQVDQLVGSRAQIVIKPIGQQLSSVGYVGGATILANGKVSLILDGQTIARRVLTTARAHQVDQSAATTTTSPRSARKTVMVVDDSVTVRKVTSRLLERQGFDVITANDGVDAIEKLAQVTPDLMLLDIEMPRMDGFEVATYVRHDSNFKTLPIIMITSRTGEKHREHALSLGVNAYMGKPFQEADLMANIQQVLATEKLTTSS